MKCKKIEPLLPLLAGSELPESQILLVRSHLEGCSRCQAEFQKYEYVVGQTREWLTKGRIGWEESEWQRIVRSVVSQVPRRRTALVPWPFPKTWAYALMAGVMLLLTVLVVQPPSVKQIGMASKYMDTVEVEEQEVVSMTMVSKETGLKVVWFFNKNFNLEENE
jgi:hypothetical protein